MLFKLVRGGNVAVVREILRQLHSEGLERELAWATGKIDGGSRHGDGDVGGRTPDISPFAKRLCFLLLAAAFVLASPVFYALHAVFCQLDARRYSKQAAGRGVRLPLFYGLLSGERDMVELLLANDCSPTTHDSDGNNVYHHLAVMSARDGDGAVRCHELLSSVYGDVAALRHAITEQENNVGYTAWEQVAKYGSLRLFCRLANDRSGFGELVLAVTSNSLWGKRPECLSNDVDGNDSLLVDCPSSGGFNVWRFDVVKYESGLAYSKQSYPLQLIVGRAVEKLRKEDTAAILQSDFITKWMSKKLSKYIAPCVGAHLVSFAITVVFLLHIIWHQGDLSPTPLYDATWVKETYAAELYKISDAVWHGNESVPTYNPSTSQYETGHHHTVNSCLFRLRRLEVNQQRLFVDECLYQLITKWQEKCAKECHCEITTSFVISHLTLPNDDDETAAGRSTQFVLYLLIGACVLQDLICRMVFLVNNYNWSAHSWRHVVLPVLARRMPGSYLERQIGNTMYLMFCVGVEVGHRYRYTVKEAADEMMLFFSEAWHVSDDEEESVDRQAHVDKLLALFEGQHSLSAVVDRIVIVCLLLRFLQTIYALRLLPNVGFFVITAKKMAHHLLQFAVVFIIVLLAFGTIFYFIMRQSACPAKKIKAFQTLAESLFSTYQTSLGEDELDFSLHLNAQIAYVAFTLICSILLLNLIIAVMTTTVERMNQSPWKVMLGKFELWDEILWVEAVVLVFLGPVRRLIKRQPSTNSGSKTTLETVQCKNATYFN